ncbi:hypothetical protein GCM10012275_63850 [Longimycelium tulufanense]|uniref:Uncharacterized protein n=1 Tax=Longimycelium tulufanense TaxID=907463 RepID=A0A8J3CKV7_9PSEU|nr:hypothetical protein [Longimycelium tulufanense]GGM84412.1 hypothetical protein GCM10012275_63850 [Longimycelium tulufanense]
MTTTSLASADLVPRLLAAACAEHWHRTQLALVDTSDDTDLVVWLDDRSIMPVEATPAEREAVLTMITRTRWLKLDRRIVVPLGVGRCQEPCCQAIRPARLVRLTADGRSRHYSHVLPRTA